MGNDRRFGWLLAACLLMLTRGALAQIEPSQEGIPPIATVPVDGVKLTGALVVDEGQASVQSGGTVVAGGHDATLTLPSRGSLRLCSTSKVTLTRDSSIAGERSPGEAPGLMMALDRGAVEANFATGENSDVILTPDFRIVISGPGKATVQVRLGMNGDTCVDNRGTDAPYVSVSSIFDGGFYRVHPGQRVMFEGGDLGKVVDHEKESCGCPSEEPVPSPTNNSFPVAQSAGLAEQAGPPPNAATPGVVGAQATAQLSYNGTAGAATAKVETPPTVAPVAVAPPDVHRSKPKHGFFRKVGYYLRSFFGG
jgi:hypothetical protein